MQAAPVGQSCRVHFYPHRKPPKALCDPPSTKVTVPFNLSAHKSLALTFQNKGYSARLDSMSQHQSFYTPYCIVFISNCKSILP